MNLRPNFGQIIKVSVACAVIAALALANNCAPGFAEELTSGTGSRQARTMALQSLPFQELNQQTQVKIRDVLQKPSIYRRLPVKMIDIDPEYFVFLARHPEVVVNIWKIMGITKMTTTRTGPFSITSNDGAGTVSNVELIYGTNKLQIFYGEGTYEGPVLRRKLRGECVLILNTDYQKSANGKPTATSQLDVFLKIENATASLIAKTLNPIVGSSADHNFVESLNFLQRLNETTTKNGVGVQRMANRLTDINNETRQEFINVAGAVYSRSEASKSFSRNENQQSSGYSIPAPPKSTYPANAYPSQGSINNGRSAAPISASFGDPQYNYGQLSVTNQNTAQTGYVAQPQQQSYPYPAYSGGAGQVYQNGQFANGQTPRQQPGFSRPNIMNTPAYSGDNNPQRFPPRDNLQRPQFQPLQFRAPSFQAPRYPTQNYRQ